MAKQTGLGDNLYVSQYDLSGDVGQVNNISSPRGSTEVTAIDKSAIERLFTTKDGQITFNSFFNDAAGQSHLVLRSLPTADRIVSYFRGTAVGSPACSMLAKQINYDGTRNADGSLTFDTQALANGFGLDWGRQLTAGKITHASATAGTALDGGAASSFGFQAFLHIFSLGSGTPTIKIQSSSDNAGDAYADITGGTFTIQDVGSERIATAADAAIERYLKVVTTGTFSNLVFAVSVCRNATAPEF